MRTQGHVSVGIIKRTLDQVECMRIQGNAVSSDGQLLHQKSKM